jgi:hypothetical protein
MPSKRSSGRQPAAAQPEFLIDRSLGRRDRHQGGTEPVGPRDPGRPLAQGPAWRLTCRAAVEFIMTRPAAARPVAAKCCSMAR